MKRKGNESQSVRFINIRVHFFIESMFHYYIIISVDLVKCIKFEYKISYLWHLLSVVYLCIYMNQECFNWSDNLMHMSSKKHVLSCE